MQNSYKRIILACIFIMATHCMGEMADNSNSESAVKWLFLLHTSEASVSKANDGQLSLTVPVQESQLVAFTDGPIRIVKTMDLSDLDKAWKEIEKNTLGHPSAVLSLGDKNGTIVLSQLSIDNTSAVLNFKMGSVHKDIFVDGDSGILAMVIDSYTPCLESCKDTAECKDICVLKVLS